ncbi:MAG TPA: AmmeMemoRadiSam system radical SAM enzyme [Candidatus Thermoplasmatota archaeon]|nr:AmmeMemoRadiSam system radical SAM enzyme [Candidatus Thermoplasmatota archaeon]
MKREARFWNSVGHGNVQCALCPHHCRIAAGKRGICGVRENEDGRLYSLIYAACSSVADDPIEKKPLYHFYPGSRVLSLGSVGCTFRCEHCQNFTISMAGPDSFGLRDIQPEAVVQMAKDHRCQGVAWTYNEPTIWHEYAFDTARLVKKAGLYTVYVTNGFMEEAPLREIAPYLDAMNIDVKAFREEFYRKICKGQLAPVLRACELAKQLGIHLELTYLVIPGLNDDVDEVTRFCSWVREALGADTPVHFSRFHPDYKMEDTPATPIETLLEFHKVAKQAGLQYVYLGNLPHGEYENSYCPSCGVLLIERHGYNISQRAVAQGRCMKCGTSVPFRIG